MCLRDMKLKVVYVAHIQEEAAGNTPAVYGCTLNEDENFKKPHSTGSK